MKFRILVRWIAVVVAAAAVAGAADQTGGGGSTAPVDPNGTSVAPELDRSDQAFIEKAAKSGKDEVIISQIALNRATNPQVKEFAQTMVTDHGMANVTLAQLASTKGVKLPLSAPVERKWSKKTGRDFDREYLDRMIDDHRDAVTLFEKAGNSSDGEVAAFAQARLTALREHFEKASAIKKAMKR